MSNKKKSVLSVKSLAGSTITVLILCLFIRMLGFRMVYADSESQQSPSSLANADPPYIVMFNTNFSAINETSQVFGDSVLTAFASIFKDSLTNYLELDIHSDDVGEFCTMYILNVEPIQSLMIFEIDKKSSVDKAIKKWNSKNNEHLALARRGKLLILSFGDPTQEQIDAVLESTHKKDTSQEAFSVDIAWHKIIGQSNLGFEELLSKTLDRQFGITREDASLPQLVDKLTQAEFGTQFVLSVKNFQASIGLADNNLFINLEIEPLPLTSFAEFVENHQHRELGHLEFFPSNSDILAFASIDPEALTKFQQSSLEYDLMDVPWSKLEENYLRDIWQEINDNTGDFSSFALYRHPSYGLSASMFFESLESQNMLWKWLNIFRLYAARDLAVEEAALRNAGYESTFYANPYNLPEMIESWWELPLGSITESRHNLRDEQLYYLDYSSEDETIMTLGTVTVPEGAVVVVNQNCIPLLDQFALGYRYDGTNILSGDQLLIDKEPWLGILININGIAEILDQFAQDNPAENLSFDWLFPEHLGENDVISILSWVENGSLHARLHLPVILVKIIDNIMNQEE